MNTRQLAIVVTFIACQACAPILAQAGPASVPDRNGVAQKQALVARFLADSTPVDSGASPASTEAHRQLAKAGDLHERARAQLEKGDLAAADQSLNEAMRIISSVRERTVGPGIRESTEQARHAQLVQSIEVLQMSYLRIVERRSSWLAEVGDEDLKRVRILVNRAKAMASSGQLIEANAVLVRAQRDMILSYNGLLGTAPMVIVYDLRFSSGEEEYKYELERTQDYEGLVPVATQEYKPTRELMTSIDRLLTESRALAAHARSLAEQKQFMSAIQRQREAIAKLQHALEVAGVVVPQRLPN